jgi:hypothetical protein
VLSKRRTGNAAEVKELERHDGSLMAQIGEGLLVAATFGGELTGRGRIRNAARSAAMGFARLG